MFLANQLDMEFSGNLVLRNIQIDARQACSLALIGPNGSGKSTLAHLLVGLLEPTRGVIELHNVEESDVAMQFQNVPLFESMTVLENCRVHFSLNKKKFSRDLVQELLRFWSLNDKSGQLVRELSGGQRQALSICLTLFSEPKFLILDEPMNNLDPEVRVFVRERLEKLKEAGTRLMLISHDLAEVEKLADILVVVLSGRVVAVGDAEILKKQHNAATLEDLYIRLVRGSGDND